VFRFVVTGMLNKQVAFDLGTTEKTIKVHRARVMEKMGAQSLQIWFALPKSSGSVPNHLMSASRWSLPLDQSPIAFPF